MLELLFLLKYCKRLFNLCKIFRYIFLIIELSIITKITKKF